MKLDLSQPWTGSVPIESVVANPDQPRKFFDLEALARTAKSCSARQIQPINVIAHADPGRPEARFMIVDGERRWRGLMGIGAKRIKVTYDPDLNAESLFEASFAANFCREGHTHEETVAAVGKLVAAGRTLEQIADMIGKSKAWVGNYSAIGALHPELLKKMDFAPDGERKLSMKVALLLISLKPFDQLSQWSKVKNLPTSEAFHKIRTSGKVRHTGKRSAVDDADYAESRASKAQEMIETLVTLPLAMLKNLSVESLTTIIRILGNCEKSLGEATERMRSAHKDAKRKEAA